MPAGNGEGVVVGIEPSGPPAGRRPAKKKEDGAVVWWK
jgi:hypothetical protein